jgi:taurine dioxygenase
MEGGRRQVTSTAADIEVLPSGGALGAEVRGVDLARLEPGALPAIHRAWLERSVLLFRDQRLTDADLIGFSSQFGELDHAPIQENGRASVEGHPEIYVVSNVLGADGKPIGSLGAGEAVWHTDMSYLPEPPKASMLYSIEVPESGGDTWFCDMYAAYRDLPADLCLRIRGMKVKHDGTYNSGGFLRAGVTATDDPRAAPGQVHPLVCRHPESGRPMLYLGRRRNAWIDGMDRQESDHLLDAIWEHATKTSLLWRHRWRVGDLVLWDNRCTMHRRDPFDPGARRIMHRTQIKGAAPPAA